MATIGDATVEASWQPSFNQALLADGPFVASASKPIDSLSAQIDGNGVSVGGTQQFLLAIYADSAGVPGALVASGSSATTVASAAASALLTQTVSSGSIVSGQSYWVAILFSVVSGGTGEIIRLASAAAGGPGFAYKTGNSFSMPGTFPTPDATGGGAKYTMYGTYTVSSPPVNTVLPAVTGTATEGQTLTCSTGTWTGDVSSGYAYQWQRDNYNDGVFVNVPGETSSTYIETIVDVGCNVDCVVTATGTGGSASATSNVVGPVAAGPISSTVFAPSNAGFSYYYAGG